MAEESVLTFGAFTGVDQSLSEMDVPLNASPDAQNMQVLSGELATAKGYVKTSVHGVPDGNVLSLHRFVRHDANGNPVKDLLACTDHGLYKRASDGTWTLLLASFKGPADSIGYSVGSDAVLLLGSSSGKPICWDGSNPPSELTGLPDKTEPTPAAQAADAATDEEEPKMRPMASLCLYYERVWGAGNNDHPERVWFSKSFDPKDWSSDGSGYIDVNGWSGSRILAVRNYFSDVVVFKTNEVFRIYGTFPDEFAVSRVEGQSGPLTGACITPCGDRVYFLSREGVCCYDGMRATPLGDEKLKTLLAALDVSRQTHCCAATVGNKVYFAVAEGESEHNNLLIEYDTRAKSYMLHRGVPADCLLNDDGMLLFAGRDGFVYQFGKGSDAAGVPMEAYWTTPRLDLGAQYLEKTVTTFYARVNGKGKLRITAYFDRAQRQKDIPLYGHMQDVRLRLPVKGRTVQFRFANVDGSVFSMHTPQIMLESDED